MQAVHPPGPLQPAHCGPATGATPSRSAGRAPKRQRGPESAARGRPGATPDALPERMSSLYQAATSGASAAAEAAQELWARREGLALPPRPPLPSAERLQELLPWGGGARDGSAGAAAASAAEEAEAAAALSRTQARASEAVRLLRRRAAAGSAPGRRADGHKLGLVIEGGGMRGAVSAGGLQALHDLGLRDCFDAVYGSSAGALNATYFLSGQRAGVDIYAQDISNASFIDLRRLLRRRPGDAPALDLAFLIDHVMQRVKPLDWQAVIESPVPLKIVASCLDSLQPVLLSDFRDQADLRACLFASATVPAVAGPPVRHRGRRLVDAAVFEAVPFRAAIADGCTHVLALATRPPLRREEALARLVDEGVAAIVKKAVLSPAYMKAAWRAEAELNRAFGCTADELLLRALAPGSEALPGFAGCHVFPVYPGAAASFSPLCIDPATIMLGVAEGRAAVLRALELPLPLPAQASPPEALPREAAREAGRGAGRGAGRVVAAQSRGK